MLADDVDKARRQEGREVVKEGVAGALKDIGATLKEKFDQGRLELANLLYQESGIPVPEVVSQSQIAGGVHGEKPLEAELGQMVAEMQQKPAKAQGKEIER